MTIEERKCKLNEMYDEMISLGLIRNKKDLATLIDVNYNCLTQAMNGIERYLTDSLVSKVKSAFTKSSHSISISDSPGAIVANGDHNNVNAHLSSLDPSHQYVKMIPTIPIHAYRAIDFDVWGYLNQPTTELHMSPIVMQFPGTDCYYFVNSEDMSPNLRTNDLLCLSRLPDEAKVTNGDLCVVNTRFQGILERFIYDDDDAFILKSTQSRWTDMRIPKKEVFSIFRILGGIRTNI